MKKLISLITASVMLLCSLAVLSSCSNACGASLNGKDLSNYVIVYSDEDADYSLRAAEYIKAQILARVGADIPIIEDDETRPFKREIVVGETSREISQSLDADTEGLEFAIMADSGNIALEGDYFVIAAAAYYFVEAYISPECDSTVPEGVSVHEPIVEEAKNHIILIGDGMGLYQTQMFDYLDNDFDVSDGEEEFYGYRLPYQGQSITNSLSGLTDSAASATAMACGVKTTNGRVGRDKDGADLKSLTELAIELGKSAAVMSTEKSTGATPSGFSAHADNRNDTIKIVADQGLIEDEGVIINCDYNNSTKFGIQYIETQISDTLEELEDEDGYFLMYEEAYIDKHCHSNNLYRAFEALMRFNQAIGRFMEYAFYNPDTFVLITADHETGGLAPDASGNLVYSTDDHTNANVLIFAYGDGAELFDGQTIENTQIAHTVASFWGVYDFGDQSTHGYLR